MSCSYPFPSFSTLLAAPAKVNLGLKIVRRRPDGYHDLLTVMEPISLVDNLYCEFSPGKDCRCLLHCPQLPELSPDDNLVVRAAMKMAALARSRGLGPSGRWSFFLDKRIPSGAGLGGGSSNAAAVVGLLEKFYLLNLSREEKLDIALSLGADVPFFLDPGLARVEGIGERVSRLQPPRPRWYVLIKPAFGVATAWAYAALRAKERDCAPVYDTGQFTLEGEADGYLLENDFEKPVMERYPRLAELKAWFAGRPGCRGTLMSGSGSVVYGIFGSFAEARKEFADAIRQWSGSGCRVFLARNLRIPISAAGPGVK